jgi:hypothetical protein
VQGMAVGDTRAGEDRGGVTRPGDFQTKVLSANRY